VAETLVAPFDGSVEDIVGAVVSPGADFLHDVEVSEIISKKTRYFFIRLSLDVRCKLS
jgi:hypothetical protein